MKTIKLLLAGAALVGVALLAGNKPNRAGVKNEPFVELQETINKVADPMINDQGGVTGTTVPVAPTGTVATTLEFDNAQVKETKIYKIESFEIMGVKENANQGEIRNLTLYISEGSILVKGADFPMFFYRLYNEEGVVYGIEVDDTFMRIRYQDNKGIRDVLYSKLDLGDAGVKITFNIVEQLQ